MLPQSSLHSYRSYFCLHVQAQDAYDDMRERQLAQTEDVINDDVDPCLRPCASPQDFHTQQVLR